MNLVEKLKDCPKGTKLYSFIHNWSKWECPKPKFDPKTLNPFDRVLCRNKNTKVWFGDLFSHWHDENFSTVGNGYYDIVIPYNDDTKHLVGTTDEAPEYYRYWED